MQATSSDKTAEQTALDAVHGSDGFLYPFRNGYERLGVLLGQIPKDAWQRDEAVLGALILFLLKKAQALRENPN